MRGIPSSEFRVSYARQRQPVFVLRLPGADRPKDEPAIMGVWIPREIADEWAQAHPDLLPVLGRLFGEKVE